MVTKFWLIMLLIGSTTAIDANYYPKPFKPMLETIPEDSTLREKALELERKKKLGAEDLNRRTIESQKRVQQKSTKTHTQPKERVITRESERRDSEQQLEYEEYKRERARATQLEWERYELGRQQAQEQQEAEENEDLYQLSI